MIGRFRGYDDDMTDPGKRLYTHWDEVEDARRMAPEDKLRAGAELFDYACAITLAGIRSQNPGLDEAGAEAVLRERLAWARRRGM